MARLIAMILSAVTILGLGIYALQYRAQDLGSQGLTGANESAYHLVSNVSSDATVVAGQALPRLLAVVIFVLVIVMLLLIR